jgi:hypothetical protein
MIPPFQGRLKMRIEAEVNPSEDPEKVKNAISNVFGREAISNSEVGRGKVVYLTDSYKGLTKVYEQVRHKRTMAVLRRLLTKNREEGGTWFYLNKQAAFVGKVVLCEEAQESPLGPIKVSIETDDVDGLIEWLAPKEEFLRRKDIRRRRKLSIEKDRY